MCLRGWTQPCAPLSLSVPYFPRPSVSSSVKVRVDPPSPDSLQGSCEDCRMLECSPHRMPRATGARAVVSLRHAPCKEDPLAELSPHVACTTSSALCGCGVGTRARLSSGLAQHSIYGMVRRGAGWPRAPPLPTDLGLRARAPPGTNSLLSLNHVSQNAPSGAEPARWQHLSLLYAPPAPLRDDPRGMAVSAPHGAVQGPTCGACSLMLYLPATSISPL